MPGYASKPVAQKQFLVFRQKISHREYVLSDTLSDTMNKDFQRLS